MENVLIVSSSSKAAQIISDFMKESFGCNIRTADSAGQARTIISGDKSWEMVMISIPLSDESGIDLAETVVSSTAASCMVFVKAEVYEKVCQRLDKSDIIVVSRPFSRQTLYQIVRAADTALRRTWSLYEETVRLEKKIDEIKLIDKAKFTLMQYRNMTEEEAHSYLEQYAMKHRKKKTIAASEIIEKIGEQYL